MSLIILGFLHCDEFDCKNEAPTPVEAHGSIESGGAVRIWFDYELPAGWTDHGNYGDVKFRCPSHAAARAEIEKRMRR